jgi:hypothetical protein
MYSLGVSEFIHPQSWPEVATDVECRKLGIERMQRTFLRDKDFVFYTLEGTGGVVPNEMDGLISEISKLLENEHRDCWTKLQLFESPEKHLFLFSGTRISSNWLECIFVDKDMPKIFDFPFPDGVTHLWFVGGNEHVRKVRWSKNEGNCFF